MNLNENNYNENNNKEKPPFFATNAGYFVLVVFFYVVIFGITFLLSMNKSYIGHAVALPCAFFGWRVLNRFQPRVFLFMSLFGWILYFIIKFLIAAAIGMFVAPFLIARWIADRISHSVS